MITILQVNQQASDIQPIKHGNPCNVFSKYLITVAGKSSVRKLKCVIYSSNCLLKSQYNKKLYITCIIHIIYYIFEFY